MYKPSFRVCSTFVVAGALAAAVTGASCTTEEPDRLLEDRSGYDDGDDDGHHDGDDGHHDGDDGHHDGDDGHHDGDDGHHDGDDGHHDGDDGHGDDGHGDDGHHDSCEVETREIELWPPNHRWEEIDVFHDCIEDLHHCGHDCEVEVLWVSSDEPVNAQGDGNTAPDIECVDDDTVRVRSERQGPEDGRVYEIAFRVECDDDHDHGHGHHHDHDDHQDFGICRVSVPHDQGQGDEAVDSGEEYRVYCN